MSHIHIPDGIIPSIWWVTGYILTAVMLFVLIRKIKDKDMGRKIPLAGMSAAIMLLGMSIPLGFLPLHFSLAVLIGILVGPSIGVLVIFTVNVILALFGHGGITIVGINTLVIGTEVIIGYYIFKNLARSFTATKAAAVATVIALLVSLTMMVGIVGATVGLPEVIPHDDHAHEDDHHDDEDDHYHDEDDHYHDEDDHYHDEVDEHHDEDDEHHDEDDDHHDEDDDHHDEHDDHHDEVDEHHDEDDDHHDEEDDHHDEDDHYHDHDESFIEALQDLDFLVLTGWSALIGILVIGIALEATITALIVRFLYKVRPDLLED